MTTRRSVFSGYETSSQNRNESNKRIYDRNVPSHVLQPYLSVRPVMTKYSLMPIVDPRKENSVQIEQQPLYNVHTTFNPGNTQSPWSGYSSNVNAESILRNQIFALQKCSQSVYVPGSDSDLYQYSFKPDKSGNKHQPFPGLFKKENFEEFDPNPGNVGDGIFFNHTRQQLRDLTVDNRVNKQTQTQKQSQNQNQSQNQMQGQINMAQIK
jgi:hypothetical protein